MKIEKTLQTPAEELVNVKTHGWRKSRAANYKKKKAIELLELQADSFSNKQKEVM